MSTYNTDEEQIDALRRWWKENGRSTVFSVVIALSAGFGWQAYQKNTLHQQEQASDMYQSLLRTLSALDATVVPQTVLDLAEQIKSEYSGTSYAQFAALHLASIAVKSGKLPEAEAQLRWVLSKAAADTDTARIAKLRLARVVAASGDTEQALGILDEGEPGPYAISYAAARGDMLFAANERDGAREAYALALELASSNSNAQEVDLSTLQQKLQSLTPVAPAATAVDAQAAASENAAAPQSSTSVVPPQE